MAIFIILLLVFTLLFTRFYLIPKVSAHGPNQPIPKLINKKDWFLCGSITLLYAALSFYHLGNFKQDPVWYGDGAGKQINIIFDKPTVVSKIGLNGCAINHNITQLSLVDEKGIIIPIHEINNAKTTSICGDQIFATNTNKKMLGYKIKTLQPTMIIKKIYVFDKNESFLSNYTYNYNYDSKLDNPEGIFHATDYFVVNNVVGNMIFDERYYALAAYNYTIGKFDINTAHPQLSELFIAVGIKAFGMNPFGWRFIPNLFGILLLPLMYLFALQIFKQRSIAFLSMLFVACDFMHFTISRLALVEPIVVYFNILTYYYLWQYISYRQTSINSALNNLLYCAVALGLALSSKWSGGFALPIIFVSIFLSEMKNNFKYYKSILIIAIFLIVGVLIYIVCYIPAAVISNVKLLPMVIELQRVMFNIHSNLDSVDNVLITSRWWQWPIMNSTISLFYWLDLKHFQSVTLCLMGNPILWWSSIPVIIYATFKVTLVKDKCLFFLLSVYFMQILPYIIANRVMYVYYYYNIILFLFVILAEMLYSIWQLKSRFYMLIVSMYILLAMVFFTFYYPVYSASMLNRAYTYKYLKLNSKWDI